MPKIPKSGKDVEDNVKEYQDKGKPIRTLAGLAAAARGDFHNADIAGTDGGIEAQERAGQLEQAIASTLPRHVNSGTWEQLEEMGVERLGPVPGDDLFVNVELPKGWRKQPTDHAMWSNLLDDKGRTRATIFYKAAFYDRDAHINVERRFSTSYKSDSTEFGKGPFYGIAEDADGEVIFRTATIAVDETLGNDSEVRDRVRGEARRWLERNFPDYENPLAYWDVVIDKQALSYEERYDVIFTIGRLPDFTGMLKNLKSVPRSGTNKQCPLGDEVFVIATGDSNYSDNYGAGCFVRLIGDEKGAAPGDHFNKTYATTCSILVGIANFRGIRKFNLLKVEPGMQIASFLFHEKGLDFCGVVFEKAEEAVAYAESQQALVFTLFHVPPSAGVIIHAGVKENGWRYLVTGSQAIKVNLDNIQATTI